MVDGVSVVICCYNSVSRLPETLKYLARQKTADIKWEIIVVDNASTDTTRDTAINFWVQLARPDVPLVVVPEPKPGLSYARAKGVKASSFDTLIFCDDDNRLEEHYVAESYKILSQQPEVGAAGGKGIAVADVEFPSWFETYKYCYACYAQGKEDGILTGHNSFLFGAGLVLRREALSKIEQRDFIPMLPDRIGNQLTSGGDVELSYALRLAGYKLWFSEKLIFHHYLPASRLNPAYLLRLIPVMSYCSGMLIVYTYALSGKEITSVTWLKDFAYQLLFFIKQLVKYLKFPNEMSVKLDYAFASSRVKSILHQFGKYRFRYNQVVKLRSGQNFR